VQNARLAGAAQGARVVDGSLAAPTGGLWDEERTDEQQMGASYPELEWAMAQSEAGRRAAVRNFLALAKEYALDGINLDFENINLVDRDRLTGFVQEIAAPLYDFVRAHRRYVVLSFGLCHPPRDGHPAEL